MKRSFLVILFSTTLICVGCAAAESEDLVEVVKGHVTLDGKPLDGAEVVFWPSDINRHCATRTTESDGSFVVNPDATYERLTAGSFTVVVNKIVVEGGSQKTTKGSPAMRKIAMKKQAALDPDSVRNLVPEPYRAAKTSPLHVEFQGGANDLPPIVLTSK